MADPVTIVGENTHISGNVEGDEDLRVKGRVDGKVRLTHTLFVEEGGVVVADIEVKVAVVSGVMVGNVQATDLVHITESGRMVGDISAPRVILVDGAAFRGRVEMGDVDSDTEPRRVATPSPSRPSSPPRVTSTSRAPASSSIKAPSKPAPPQPPRVQDKKKASRRS